MDVCPACSKAITPSDLTCPKCGISLHPGTATCGPASGSGKALSIAAIVAGGLVAIILLLGCLGALGWTFLGISPVRVHKSTWSGIPAGSTIVYEVDDSMEEMPSEEPSGQPTPGDTQ